MNGFVTIRALFLSTLMLVALFAVPIGLCAQNVQENPLVANIVEDFLENSESESFDFNTIFENLLQYYQNPLDINTVKEDQLRDLLIISETQIRDFFDHRQKFGDFLSIFELQAIESWNIGFIRNVTSFLTIRNGFEDLYSFDWNEFYKSGKSVLFLKSKRVVQTRKGYIENQEGITPYIGDGNSYYVRYRYQAGNYFKVGITAEKDPGEPFFKDINKAGFDFYSFFIHGAKLNNVLQSVTLGDYTVSMGQGLILHNDFGGRKSSFVMNIKKGNRFVRPYSSVNEVNYFRGGAVELKLSKWFSLGIFGSFKPVNARVNSDSIESTDFDLFTSIVESGLHRTASEISLKNTIHQFNVGTSLKFNYKNLKIGANYLHTTFDRTFQRSGGLYQKYTFAGKELQNASVDYQYRVRNATFFGEFAISDNSGTAMSNGLLLGLDRKIDLALLYRKFAPQYQVLNANAFGDGSLPINEEGLYAGLDIRPFPRITLSTYVDFWKNPWVSYRRNGPATGKDYFIKIAYVQKRKLEIYAQYRYINKQLNQSSTTEELIYAPIDYFVQRVRFHMNFKINQAWEWRNRIEMSFYRKESKSRGVLLYQDLLYKPIAEKISFSMRYCIFDIESYDARIYTYENDILFEFFIPFFQNRGSRVYANMRYRVNHWLTWEFRVSNTHYTGDRLIGSGNEFIEGRNRTELKTQLKFSF
ncbi:MAG: hypothetical protein WAT79_09490 [Saprospiraceae bacterium]